jgi:hypothetical protein
LSGWLELARILRAQPLVAGNDGRFGAACHQPRPWISICFPGPVVLPTTTPIGVPTWTVAVGTRSQFENDGFGARGVIREAFWAGQIPIVGCTAWMDHETFDVTVPGELTSYDGLTDPEQVQSSTAAVPRGTARPDDASRDADVPGLRDGARRPDGRLGRH